MHSAYLRQGRWSRLTEGNPPLVDAGADMVRTLSQSRSMRSWSRFLQTESALPLPSSIPLGRWKTGFTPEARERDYLSQIVGPIERSRLN